MCYPGIRDCTRDDGTNKRKRSRFAKNNELSWELRELVRENGHVKKWEMKNWQREQMPRKWRGNGGQEEDRNCDGYCIKMTLKEW